MILTYPKTNTKAYAVRNTDLIHPTSTKNSYIFAVFDGSIFKSPLAWESFKKPFVVYSLNSMSFIMR